MGDHDAWNAHLNHARNGSLAHRSPRSQGSLYLPGQVATVVWQVSGFAVATEFTESFAKSFALGCIATEQTEVVACAIRLS